MYYWLGTKGTQGLKRSRSTSANKQPRHLLVVSHDSTNETLCREQPNLRENVRNFRSSLKQEMQVVHDYEFLGFTIVRYDEAALNNLINLPGHQYSVGLSCDIESCHTLLKSIESLHRQHLYQATAFWMERENGLVFPNDQFEGGISPPGDYPKSPKAQHVVAQVRDYEATPAWMPVINLSVGTSDVAFSIPARFAVLRLARTHLVTIAAGNDGEASDTANINLIAPDSGAGGIICVGASTDDGGQLLADYSSTGVVGDSTRRPCVIADGRSKLDSTEKGTSYAAPKVASIACLCFEAVFQVSRVFDHVRIPSKSFGVPLTGWGLIDDYESSPGLCFGRDDIPAMPFIGIYESELRNAATRLFSLGIEPIFSIHGTPVRQLIIESAKPVPGCGSHKVGHGFVNQSQLIETLANLSLGRILKLFCDNIAEADVPDDIKTIKVFVKEELDELARIGNASRPTWIYDYNRMELSVNRVRTDGSFATVKEPDMRAHAIHVAASGI